MSRTTFRGPGEDGEEEVENSVEEKESDGTEAAPDPVGESEGTRGPIPAQSDQPVYHQTEPSLLAIYNNHSPGVRVFINTPTQTPQISRSSICISIQLQQSSF
ncbi:hypothetical protein O181_083787 [Austropuccinia psidii MF-1]|uniref:Uncharacterized protein n=1 Tax=Austropuccinia psidii MF-1 TaxID=1389203 RepID=A0A9Q3FSZ7_9BASI|nr:hypothetical protein [Austropuccinia psidii MF-1]